jgi:hypothetical protein
LRNALPWIAKACILDTRRQKRALSPKQAAAEAQKTQTIAALLLERLIDPSNYSWLFRSSREMRFPESQPLPELRALLKWVIAALEHRCEALVALEPALGSRRNKNARKVQSRFWEELTLLWLRFKPNFGRLKRRHLRRFLFVCSKPFFRDVTDAKIAAYIDHKLTKLATYVDRDPAAFVDR